MRLSTFDGEPEIREHYDADGNLTGTTLVPGWTDEDRAWALGLKLREDQECPRGHYLPESSNDEFRWVADDPLICLACASTDSAMERHKDNPKRGAQLFTVRKVPKPKKRR